ncbi:unnamed protein product [Trichogramma brassicae]|uniref:Uncharacterized protein n=1 Tax=Trichogramma brassicae TaxID=86971 RepID=A0A6H5IHK6_9HYME|nr:unnamed protein product [Trichogramma brassicae]
MPKLFDDQDSSGAEEELKINEEYDKNYAIRRKKEEIQKYHEECEQAVDKSKKKKKKEKPMNLREYNNKLLVEKEGKLSDSEDEDKEKKKHKNIPYVQQIATIQESIGKALQEIDENDDGDEIIKQKINSEGDIKEVKHKLQVLTRRPSHLRVMDLAQTFSGDSGQLENMPCYVRLYSHVRSHVRENRVSGYTKKTERSIQMNISATSGSGRVTGSTIAYSSQTARPVLVTLSPRESTGSTSPTSLSKDSAGFIVSGFRSHLKNEFESWQVPSITKFEL